MKGDMHTYGCLIREALPYWKRCIGDAVDGSNAAMEPCTRVNGPFN